MQSSYFTFIETTAIIFLPEEVANSINYELPKRIQKKGSKRTSIWTIEYFHKVY